MHGIPDPASSQTISLAGRVGCPTAGDQLQRFLHLGGLFCTHAPILGKLLPFVNGVITMSECQEKPATFEFHAPGGFWAKLTAAKQQNKNEELAKKLEEIKNGP